MEKSAEALWPVGVFVSFSSYRHLIPEVSRPRSNVLGPNDAQNVIGLRGALGEDPEGGLSAQYWNVVDINYRARPGLLMF